MIGKSRGGWRLASAAVFTAALVFSLTLVAQPYSIRWVPDATRTNRVAVEISDVSSENLRQLRSVKWNSEQWQKVLEVSVDHDDVPSQLFLPAMLGSYTVTNNSLRFDPQFPLQPGVRYRAVFRPQNLPAGKTGKGITSKFALPATTTPSTTSVIRIFPSPDVLPENILKFYVHFSGPMSRGGIYDHIHLRHTSGQDVELPFLQIDEELWNDDMTRLTLFIDPGRIKRGVRPLEEVGPALEAGRKYALVIDRGWRDAAGSPLQDSFTKTFTVGSPDRTPPEPKVWKLEPGAAGTRAPLTLLFPESMDRALALRLINVVGPRGGLLDGEKELHDFERRWSFTPAEAWTAGSHRVEVQTHIEDLAGNNIGKPFEVDLFDGVQRRFTHSVVKIPFEVKQP